MVGRWRQSPAAPGRLGEILKVALAFVIAPGVMSLGLTIFLFGGYPRFFPLVAIVAYAIALLVGLPAYLALRFWGRPTLLRSTLGGGLIVALPVFLVLLGGEVPWDATSSGFVTAVNRQRTVVGYVEMALFSAVFGCFGAIGGLLFGLIIRPSISSPGPRP